MASAKINRGHRERRRRQTREGDKVRFRVGDVFLPSPEEVFAALATDTQLEGTVVSFSDSGTNPHVFAIVEVVRQQTVVVPVERLAACFPIDGENG
jgi:hypothetical protein